jgi:hypothetical protein
VAEGEMVSHELSGRVNCPAAVITCSDSGLSAMILPQLLGASIYSPVQPSIPILHLRDETKIVHGWPKLQGLAQHFD